MVHIRNSTRILSGCLLAFLCNAPLNAQEIDYGVGQWNSQGLGNHRAVIYVNKTADAVSVTVPWRRLDNVEDKGLILMDAFTDQRINNAFYHRKDKESAELIFEPASGEGTYYLYYMPGKVNSSRMWWFPYPDYVKPSETFDIRWKNSTAGKVNSRVAKIVRFESKNEFHSFYPMEIPVTQKEMSEIIEKNKGKEFLIFPEDRNFPIRMFETIPYRWYKLEANHSFEGTTFKNEAYAWQLGIFAAFDDLKGIKIVFSDLISDQGFIIPASALKCINLGGNDHLGKKFVKEVNVPRGEVQALWMITNIKEDQAPGVYRGIAGVSAIGTRSYPINISIEVKDKMAENRGYNYPKNQSRLNWLDSRIGVDNEVFAPFTPVKLEKRTVSILGRKLTFNRFGFPEKIVSTFTESNHAVTGPEKNIISRDIRLDIFQGGKAETWKADPPVITMHETGIIAWQTVLTSASISVLVKARMECDGYVNYETKIKAKKDVTIDDVKLLIPYSKSAAQYLMGMGRQGGRTPENLDMDWKWDISKTSNMVWIGAVNAGMQLKLKHITPDWAMFDLKKTGLYRDWSNDGKGGCNIRSSEDGVNVTAYTGNKSLMKGDSLVLNFALAITPFKTLDDNHWEQRYYHDSEANEAVIKKQITNNKARVMILHQGNIYNPFINYPFLTTGLLKDIIKYAGERNIKTKLYYTVRELSVYLPELWALRSLGDEVYTRENEIKMPDFSIKENIDLDFNAMGTMGHPWLYEHLRSRYDGKWHSPLPPETGVDWDMSIRTQTLSRWLNYYVEGLNWLTRYTGVKGIYLDGIGYDREFMKRLRKTMDKAAGGCLFDFHAGNTYNKFFGMNSPANLNMELFPFTNSLWFGEGFDYISSNPDYWLVEISGIPFGLYGEMLLYGKLIDSPEPPYKGMVYGMSCRLAWQKANPENIWKLWDDFGISGSELVGYWDPGIAVKTNSPDVLATTFVKKGKVLIAMANWSNKEKSLRLAIDWKKLGLNPDSAKIEIPEIDQLQSQGKADINNLRILPSNGLILIIRE